MDKRLIIEAREIKDPLDPVASNRLDAISYRGTWKGQCLNFWFNVRADGEFQNTHIRDAIGRICIRSIQSVEDMAQELLDATKAMKELITVDHI